MKVFKRKDEEVTLDVRADRKPRGKRAKQWYHGTAALTEVDIFAIGELNKE